MDSYADNLAKVNEVRNVVAADDIYNAQGQVLVKKGSRIDQQMAERVTRFKLLKPLEDSVVIENELSAATLADCFEAYLSGSLATKWFYQRYFDRNAVLLLCESACRFPVVRQKLTVLSLIMPEVFEQALFCAWFAALLSERTPDGTLDAQHVFFAGLCHDLGMIHISAEVLNKTENLSPEEWRQIQAHPVIAYNILKEIKGVPAAVARAVLEHHEALDGTGYPRGKHGKDLASEGLLLNLLDSVNAQFLKFCRPQSLPLCALIPIIQLSHHSRFGPVAKTLVVLLREAQIDTPPHYATSFAPEATHYICKQGEHLSQCLDVLTQANQLTGFRHDDPAINAIQNAIIHITVSSVQSGLGDEVYLKWLSTLDEVQDDELLGELAEAGLMMQEVLYQLEKLHKLIMQHLPNVKDQVLAKALSQQSNKLKKLKSPEASPELQSHWIFNHAAG